MAPTFPQFDWARFVSYQFERVATHGVRRAAEMRESAVAMKELGLPDGEALASAIAQVQEAVGGLGPALSPGEDAVEVVSRALTLYNRTQL
ncbi:DUF1932 domain-containing protein [Chelativorans salis]|uniref:DUF1932 domain-containing protein n=1 Tax=Chelativorans salis TaxID=2978478 RepID=UPI003CC6D82C